MRHKHQLSSSLHSLRQALTQTPADVDVEVDAVVAVVHQVPVSAFDQRAEVVLLPVRVEHVTWHLETEERASCFHVKVLLV